MQTRQTATIAPHSPWFSSSTSQPPNAVLGTAICSPLGFFLPTSIMTERLSSLVSQKSSDSGLHIQLHPLILLTISDHITRHAARSQQGPILGALLGQQNGREITLEHAFECIVKEGPNGEPQLPNEWFNERVKQCKSNIRHRPILPTPPADNRCHSQGCTQSPCPRYCRMVVNSSSIWSRRNPSPDSSPNPPRL